tara:strand:+ start:1149 stop:1721 length:573 start_codon:yes stop_codon:yes gene_type:complete
MKNIEDKIPECPKCPKCPKLDDIYLGTKNCPECPECPKLPEMNPPIQNECPDVKCPTVKCPSVNDIVSGIFPGRNPDVVDGGRYFTVDASNTYDGLSTSNFYEKEYQFPMQKLLKPDIPLRDYNIQGDLTIDNSIENNVIDTNKNKPMQAKSGYNTIASNQYSPVEYLNNIDQPKEQKEEENKPKNNMKQ